jgi:hypothetical protein
MGFFKKSRVNQEVANAAMQQNDTLSRPPRLSIRQFKRQKKNDRKINASDYVSKKAARSSKIDALLEQRLAHRQGKTVYSGSRYNPSPAPSQYLKQASDVGISTATTATKQIFSNSWWN